MGSIRAIYCNNKLYIKKGMGDYKLYSTFIGSQSHMFLCMEQLL